MKKYIMIIFYKVITFFAACVFFGLAYKNPDPLFWVLSILYFAIIFIPYKDNDDEL